MSRKPKSTSHYVLEDDTFDPEDDTVPSEQITRDIEEALRSSAAWAQGEKTLTISENIKGNWVETQETGPEFFARRRAESQETTPIDRLVFVTDAWFQHSKSGTLAFDPLILVNELEQLRSQAIEVAHSVENESNERQEEAVKAFVEQFILPLLLRRQRSA